MLGYLYFKNLGEVFLHSSKGRKEMNGDRMKNMIDCWLLINSRRLQGAA